jgi:hypothetical protein
MSKGTNVKIMNDDERLVAYYKRQTREISKFFGEFPYVAYFYDLVTDAESPAEILDTWTNLNGTFYIVQITDADKRLFPDELGNYSYFQLRVDEDIDCVSGERLRERP